MDGVLYLDLVHVLIGLGIVQVRTSQLWSPLVMKVVIICVEFIFLVHASIFIILGFSIAGMG